MKTLAQFRNHPAVQEIIIESDFGRRTYVINLKPGFATDNGGGQTSGTESTLAGVAAFLKSVAAVPVETPKQSNPIVMVKAFIAYAESGQDAGFPFALIPHAEAIAAGLPFSESFMYQSQLWAVFKAGDYMPDELKQLENLGVITPYNPEE